MNVEPTTYWNVDTSDIRVRVLKNIIDRIDNAAFETNSSTKIVELGVAALKQVEISDQDRATIHEAFLKHNSSMQKQWIQTLLHEVQSLRAKNITVLSLGCGDESVFERAVAQEIETSCPDLKLHWVGVDVEDYRSPTSFFVGKDFKIISKDANQNYRDLVSTENPVVLIGRWSYHHLGISFEEFQQRCAGCTKVILIEEPTTTELWQKSDYRVMRIVFDLLGNVIMSRAWAEQFMQDPTKFKVSYITKDILPQNVRVIDYPDRLPETAMVVF